MTAAELARVAAALEAEAVDWSAYGKCSRVCGAPMGEPCVSMSGKVVGGRPDGVGVPITHAHHNRPLLRRAVRR